MERRTLGLGMAMALLSGCYVAHERPPASEPTPSPCDDSTFDPHAFEPLRFDARGDLVGEPFPDPRFDSVPGYFVSMSDDARWLLTMSLGFHDEGTSDQGSFVETLRDLETGETTEVPLRLLDSPLSISGDGSTLLQSRLVEGSTDGLYSFVVIDRVTGVERLVRQGRFAHGQLSDDASHAVAWVAEAPLAWDVVLERVDMRTEARATVDGPRGAWVSPGALSGDGATLAYWSYAIPFAAPPDGLVVLGPGDRVQRWPDLGIDVGISDDGCEMIAGASSSIIYESGTPILNLAVFVDGQRISTGPEGEPNVPISALALSGDGGTAVVTYGSLGDYDAVLARIRLSDGRVEQQHVGCGPGHVAVSDDGSTIAVEVFACDGATEPDPHTRVYRPGVWVARVRPRRPLRPSRRRGRPDGRPG